MTTLLSIGYPQTMVQSVTYALPARAVYVFGGGTVEISNDGSNWTAIGTTNPVAAAFIHNTGSDALVCLKAS